MNDLRNIYSYDMNILFNNNIMEKCVEIVIIVI